MSTTPQKRKMGRASKSLVKALQQAWDVYYLDPRRNLTAIQNGFESIRTHVILAASKHPEVQKDKSLLESIVRMESAFQGYLNNMAHENFAHFRREAFDLCHRLNSTIRWIERPTD